MTKLSWLFCIVVPYFGIFIAKYIVGVSTRNTFPLLFASVICWIGVYRLPNNRAHRRNIIDLRIAGLMNTMEAAAKRKVFYLRYNPNEIERAAAQLCDQEITEIRDEIDSLLLARKRT